VLDPAEADAAKAVVKESLDACVGFMPPQERVNASGSKSAIGLAPGGNFIDPG
jgi:hypothetical protein